MFEGGFFIFFFGFMYFQLKFFQDMCNIRSSIFEKVERVSEYKCDNLEIFCVVMCMFW